MKCFITDKTKRFEESPLELREGSSGEMQQVKVYEDVTYQEIIGIGGALTEAAAHTYAGMSPKKQEEILSLYFGPEGNNYSFCRLHIQSCDFALGNYAYVEDPEDKELKTFSIDRDRKYILPLVKAAVAKNKDLEFLASPWSPPAYMKTNGDMNHGGKLKPEYKKMWADMMARFVTEYQKEGVKVGRLTVQNEPAAVQTWDSCIYSALEEAEFAVNYLHPSLVEAGKGDVKINVWDHNKEIMLDRAKESFGVEGAEDVISGMGFHWYSGDHFEALGEVCRRYAGKEMIFTEGCVEYSRYASDNQIAHAQMYAHDMIGDFNAGANAFIDWNIYLNSEGGPNHVGNFCDAPIMCNPEEDTVDIKLSYYYIGHFSRFVKPGARRILVSKYTGALETVGFLNPDGQKVLIVLNPGDEDKNFTLFDGKVSCDHLAEAHSIATFLW